MQTSDSTAIQRRVYAAMETGNAGEARRFLKEHEETYPEIVAELRKTVLQDYGIKL